MTMSESFSFVVVAKAVYSRLPLKLHDWWACKVKVFLPKHDDYPEVFMKTVKDGRSAVTRGWTRVVCAFCMEEGTIWAFRFTLFSNQNIFRLSLYHL